MYMVIYIYNKSLHTHTKFETYDFNKHYSCCAHDMYHNCMCLLHTRLFVSKHICLALLKHILIHAATATKIS